MAVLSQFHEPVHWTIIFVVPLYLLIHLFGLGIMLVVARATAFTPDLKPIVSLILRVFFFCSGVFFSMEHFPDHSSIRTVMEYNPVYAFLMTVRECTLYGEIPDPGTWVTLTVWTVVALVVGMVYFWAAEERYPRVQS